MMGPFSDGRERPTRGTDLEREIQKDIIDLRNIMEMTSADAEFSWPFCYILLQFIITIAHYFYGRHDITLCELGRRYTTVAVVYGPPVHKSRSAQSVDITPGHESRV